MLFYSKVFTMSINVTDDKFGLPKPDFQQFPKKRSIGPILAVSATIATLIGAKMGYTFYLKSKDVYPRGTILDKNSSNNNLSKSPSPSGSSGSSTPSRVASSKLIDTTVRQPVTHRQSFEDKNNAKVKYNISETQKQLAAKSKKSLVKPGTYQELKVPQGIYHLVVFSHLQKPSAMKMVQQLIKAKLGVCLILPRIKKNERYYRVTIGQSKTYYEAEQKLKKFKSTYRHLFILKY